MANINEQINNQRDAAASGRNNLVSQLASKRVYDEAVRSLDHQDRRPKMNFSRVVSTEHTRLVTDAYPEFSISFTATKNSVHSLAGGLRLLELEYMMMQVPYGSPCYDIGGNYTQHLFKGRSYVHCCNPCLDLKDVARNVMYNDMITQHVQRHKGSGGCRPLPTFQIDAFRRYDSSPCAVTCSDVFQECSYDFGSGRDNHAVSLHSIYDIPYSSIGPALHRKNVRVCYAAFHFSEALLLGSPVGNLNSIGAQFRVDGDDVHFLFSEESTLHYTHSLENIKLIVMRTYFPADDRFVYIKEFMVKRVDTFFFRLVRADTHMLHKSVGHYSKSKSEYFALNTPPIFQDKATFSVWFPEAKRKVLIPKFELSRFLSGNVKISRMLVDADFVHTIINHISTYDNKALVWKNVQSFVESIRSRVIVNGVSVKSEWNVPVDQLTDISFSIFLLVKVRKVQIELMSDKVVIEARGLLRRFADSLKSAVEGLGDCVYDALVQTGWFDTSSDELKVLLPEPFMTFSDYLEGMYEADAKIERESVSELLASGDDLFKKIDEIRNNYSGVEFDVEKFQEFCKELNVNPMLIGHVIEAIFSQKAGVTVTGLGTLSPEMGASVALSNTSVDTCEDMDVTEDMEDIVLMADKSHSYMSPEMARWADVKYGNNKGALVEYKVGTSMTLPATWAEKGKAILPLSGICVRKPQFSKPLDEEDDLRLSNMNFFKVSDLKLKKTITPVVYTGTIRERQMKNYIDYLSASLGSTLGNLERIVRSDWNGTEESMQTFGLYDCERCKWLLLPAEKKHAWAVVLASDDTTRIIFLSYDESGSPIIDKKNWKRFAVCSETKVYSVIRSLEVLNKEAVVDPGVHITLVDGVPGCGKTAEIIARVNWKTDLVLTPGREAAAMIRRRACALHKSPVATSDNVRTFDSFVMNRKIFKFDAVYVDEGLMVHTGLLNFALKISGCKKAFVFGDAKQIPFINRVMNFDYPKELRTLIVDNVERRYVTHRCPRDVTSFLNTIYKAAVATTSPVVHSVKAIKVSGAGILRPELTKIKGKIITFTQSDKQSLIKSGYNDVNTVHEIQGETFEETAVVRATPTPIGLIARDSPHVLVALTRHTKAMVYYTVVFDAVTSIIADVEKVDQSILTMFATTVPTK